jgi:hypothetical protein
MKSGEISRINLLDLFKFGVTPVAYKMSHDAENIKSNATASMIQFASLDDAQARIRDNVLCQGFEAEGTWLVSIVDMLGCVLSLEKHTARQLWQLFSRECSAWVSKNQLVRSYFLNTSIKRSQVILSLSNCIIALCWCDKQGATNIRAVAAKYGIHWSVDDCVSLHVPLSVGDSIRTTTIGSIESHSQNTRSSSELKTSFPAANVASEQPSVGVEKFTGTVDEAQAQVESDADAEDEAVFEIVAVEGSKHTDEGIFY